MKRYLFVIMGQVRIGVPFDDSEPLICFQIFKILKNFFYEIYFFYKYFFDFYFFYFLFSSILLATLKLITYLCKVKFKKNENL